MPLCGHVGVTSVMWLADRYLLVVTCLFSHLLSTFYFLLTLVLCRHADADHTPGGLKTEVTSRDYIWMSEISWHLLRYFSLDQSSRQTGRRMCLLNFTKTHTYGPCDELATCPGSTLPSALRQSWDWLQQQHPATKWKGISGYGQWHDMTWHILRLMYIPYVLTCTHVYT